MDPDDAPDQDPDPDPNFPNILNAQWLSATGEWASVSGRMDVPLDEVPRAIGLSILEMLADHSQAMRALSRKDGILQIARQSPDDDVLTVRILKK